MQCSKCSQWPCVCRMKITIGTSLVTGEEVEFYEPVAERQRVIRRVVFGARPVVGEIASHP